MKSRSKTMKISALSAVSALALSGLAFASSAFAADTVTPAATPTISPMPGGGSADSEQGDESDAALSAVEGQEEDAVEAEAADTEVEGVEAEDAQEEAEFADDVSSATQAGDTEAVAQLGVATADVASVNAPVVQAMTADNTQAHVLITGPTLK